MAAPFNFRTDCVDTTEADVPVGLTVRIQRRVGKAGVNAVLRLSSATEGSFTISLSAGA